MSSISECLSSLSYYLCCCCCCDTAESTTTKSLLSHEGLAGRQVTAISPSMNGNSSISGPQNYGSLGDVSQQVIEYTAAAVSDLTGTPYPFSASSSAPPSSPFNRPLTPPSRALTPPISPGSESDTERSPFDWRKHAKDHTSPHK